MSNVHTVWDDTHGDAERVVLVHGILRWGSDSVYGFGHQKALARQWKLIALDRRGYGQSPDTARSDYRRDAVDIIGVLSPRGHLVGHSYGAVGAMVAAAQRPDLVQSLTLIQPGCLQVAQHDPLVSATLLSNRKAYATYRPEISPRRYLRAATESVGLPPLDESPERLRAATTTMREFPCWEGELPIAAVARAEFPKLVIVGDWTDAPEAYKRLAGEALMITAKVTAERIGAELATVAGYYPHVQHPEIVNPLLERFWVSARTTGTRR